MTKPFKIFASTFLILTASTLFSQKSSETKDYKNLSTLCDLLIGSSVDTTSSHQVKTAKEINFDDLTFLHDSTINKDIDGHYKITVDQSNKIKTIAFYEGKKFIYKLLRLATPKEVTVFSIVRKEFTWPNEPDKPELLLFGYLVAIDGVHFTLDYVGGPAMKFKNLMFVDKKLNVKSYCVFENGRMTHTAKVDYKENSMYRVVLYIPFENEKLDKSTSISVLKKYDRKFLDEICSFLTCTTVSINKDYWKYPLWLFRDFTYACK